MNSGQIKRPDFSGMISKWPSTVIAREKVGEFTGGAVNPRTMANLDSAGDGIADRFRIGRKIVYPVQSFVRWLEERATCL